MEVGDHLLPGPTFFVHSGIDHEPDRSPHLVFETSVIAVRILIATDFFSQPFRIESPAFHERGVSGVAPKLSRFVISWAREGGLQVMTRNAFVVGNGLDV